MVWFVCDDCGDSIKKPKVPQHLQQCSASRFTCIDCSRSFDRHSVKGHATCVTEADKYAKGATKPGGYAAKGYYKDSSGATVATTQPEPASANVLDTSCLSTRPPWTCSVCNVTVTSQDTLAGHAAGFKHRRRVKAAAKEAESSDAPQKAPDSPSAQTDAAPVPAATIPSKRAADTGTAELPPKSKKQKQSDAAPQSEETTAQADVLATNGSAVVSQQQSLEKVKWKKLAAKALKEHKGPMKLSKLQKQLCLAAHIAEDLTAGANALIASRLKGSSQFKMTDKMVSLA